MDAKPAKPEGGRRQKAAAERLFARFSRCEQGRAGPRESNRAPADANKDAILQKIVDLASRR
ncbi:MAG: hypothetical protein ACREDD_13675 [Methylocella sp.]